MTTHDAIALRTGDKVKRPDHDAPDNTYAHGKVTRTTPKLFQVAWQNGSFRTSTHYLGYYRSFDDMDHDPDA